MSLKRFETPHGVIYTEADETLNRILSSIANAKYGIIDRVYFRAVVVMEEKERTVDGISLHPCREGIYDDSEISFGRDMLQSLLESGGAEIVKAEDAVAWLVNAVQEQEAALS